MTFADKARTRPPLPPVLALLFLLAVAGRVAGQDLVLHAVPNPAAVYDKVTLSVIIPTANAEEVSARFPEHSTAVHVISGPYVQPYMESANGGEQMVRVSYVIEGTEPGRIVLPPLSVSVAGSTRKTSPIVMSFGVPHDGKIVVPLQPVWEVPAARKDHPLYAGQTIAVQLELRNEVGPTSTDSLRVAGVPREFLRLPGVSKPSKSIVGGTALYQIPVASFLLTPNTTGPLALPAVSVLAGSRSGESVPKTIQITSPPAAISKSGAIGIFSFRSWTTKRTVSGGEEVSLHLRVEGAGNLPVVVLPRPEADGLLELGRDETHKTVPGLSGFTGFRETDYHFLAQAAQPGGATGSGATAMIRVPDFTWLDPASGRVESAPGQTFTFELPKVAASGARSSLIGHSGAPGAASAGSGASGPASPGSPLGRPPARPPGTVGSAAAGASSPGTVAGIPFAIESPTAIRGSEYRAYYADGNTYLWLLPGPAIFCLFLLVRPKRKKGGGLAAAVIFVVLLSCRLAPPHDAVSAGVAAYEAGRLAQAEQDFTLASRLYPKNAALSFDLGLVQFRRGRYGEAIHELRTAVFYSPLSRKYRAALAWMVGQIGVPEQVPPAYPIHPDLFLFALIAGINAASILGIIVLFRRSGKLAIALILLLVVSVISAGGLGYTTIKRTAETGVVKSSGTEMTKIPMAAASRWLELPAGMAVHIRDKADGYYLVRTAYGNTGWVRAGSLLIDGQ